MTRLSYILLVNLSVLTTFTVYGQTCLQTGLSPSYDFITSIKRIKMGQFPDSCIVSVTIENKTTKNQINTFLISTDYLLDDSSFVCCDNVRSYTTGKNKNMQVADNDYGDIIVADFNFDNKEDFALKREQGGNGGPLYNYYIQTPNATFALDSFLSGTMTFFPKYFNKKKKTLTTLVHANAYQLCKTIYKFDMLTNKWNEIGHSLIGGKKRFVLVILSLPDIQSVIKTDHNIILPKIWATA